MSFLKIFSNKTYFTLGLDQLWSLSEFLKQSIDQKRQYLGGLNRKVQTVLQKIQQQDQLADDPNGLVETAKGLAESFTSYRQQLLAVLNQQVGKDQLRVIFKELHSAYTEIIELDKTIPYKK